MNKGYKRIYAKIDLDCIRHNLLEMKKGSAPSAGFMAVVKADGYGHGALEVAEEIRDLVWGFAVATPEEGLSLRKHGIDRPILVLGNVAEERLMDLILQDIRIPVFTSEKAEQISEAAKALKKNALVHLKVDTGMGRIGLMPDGEGLETAQKIGAMPGLITEGIFTHLATADMEDHSGADRQIRIFLEFRNRLTAAGLSIPLCHYANSAASMKLDNSASDLCRIGISLYGLYPSEEVDWSGFDLQPALSLYSSVTYVKKLPGGAGIGYGGTYHTRQESIIATVGCGYADGIPRSLSNCGRVLIRGKRVPIVGRICMDQFMVDVTELFEAFGENAVAEGEPVVIIGRDGAECITMEEQGRISGRFNYELACDITKRVPRVYMKSGCIRSTRDYFDC